MLADSIRETAEWALGQMFKLALTGENTAGRLATCFGIKLKPDTIRHHDPVSDPAARVVRELRMAVGVLGEDLEQGSLRSEAVRIYTNRLQRLGLQAPAPSESDYQRAAENAQLYLANVAAIMTDVMSGSVALAKPTAKVSQLPACHAHRRDLH
jgi:hypothetical protein